tara:strand:- start:66 stop:377 length:312 start_codon:yes stop_codon:yes gene_type:complete
MKIGQILDILTTPQPTCVQGATGDIGRVPEVGFHVEALGYHADRFSASLISSLEIERLVPFTNKPPLSVEAPVPSSPDKDLNIRRTSLRIPAVLGVANDVPDV